VLPETVPTQPPAQPLLGWREWLGLPALGIDAIKAKIDTGARSSALHVEALETFHESGVLKVRFVVRVRRRGNQIIICQAPVSDRRQVTDSGGHRSERWFIRTDIVLAGRRFSADMNLSDRRSMLFPLLVGRSTLDGRFGVDPALSYTCPRPTRNVSAQPRLLP
jgi:hypothetical protein